MKKKVRFQLNRETVRSLTREENRAIRGGTGGTCTACNTVCDWTDMPNISCIACGTGGGGGRETQAWDCAPE